MNKICQILISNFPNSVLLHSTPNFYKSCKQFVTRSRQPPPPKKKKIWSKAKIWYWLNAPKHWGWWITGHEEWEETKYSWKYSTAQHLHNTISKHNVSLLAFVLVSCFQIQTKTKKGNLHTHCWKPDFPAENSQKQTRQQHNKFHSIQRNKRCL